MYILTSLLLGLATASDFPTITLPWGTWQATTYVSEGDLYIFPNIRFGKAPTGNLRFRAPLSPDPIPYPQNLLVQDSSVSPACHQLDTNRCDCPPSTCPEKDVPEGSLISANRAAPHRETEDCLFLDLYVPASAFSDLEGGPKPELPVVVWFYGGAFLFGAKNSDFENLPLYNGTGIIQAAAEMGGGEEDGRNGIIFVAPNYRLGAFGWLAGPSLAADGTPNAGLADQRLALEWVRDYIHLVGGDAKRVSAWGQSAGAGSIMHHLIADGGKRDPLFNSAFIMSPGFEWQWEVGEDAVVEEAFQNFTTHAGCEEGGLQCLRNLTEKELEDANYHLFQEGKCTGKYTLGPSVDGDLIKELPSVALPNGNYWKGLDSLIVSHVAEESLNFVPKYVQEHEDFGTFLHNIIPQEKHGGVRSAIQERYNKDVFGNARDRSAAVIRDAFFVCNTRHLFDAYHSAENRSVYAMQYSFLQTFGLAVHASDLLPLFWNPQFPVTDLLQKFYPWLPGFIASWLGGSFGDYARKYQRYFTSFAVFGEPNSGRERSWATPKWRPAKAMKPHHHHRRSKGLLARVMEASFSLLGNYFNPRTVDQLNTAETCNFWAQVAKNVSQTAEEVEELKPAGGGLDNGSTDSSTNEHLLVKVEDDSTAEETQHEETLEL